MGQYLPEISSVIAQAFANSISNAVGDGINEDVLSKGLITQNGNPGRIWDILHTDLANSLDPACVVAKPSRRGAWKILPVFDKQTGILFCCMREKNFSLLCHRNLAKQKRHYLFALSKAFNNDLPSLQVRLDVFQDNNNDDSDLVKVAIARITDDLGIPANIIERHALILFHAVDNQLLTLRCCAINGMFEIVDSINWDEFIPDISSAIVDTVENDMEKSQAYKPKLKLKEKAKSRIDRKSSIAIHQEEEENKNLD